MQNIQIQKNWLRLRTLITVRWFAILGQMVTLVVAKGYHGFLLPFGWCYIAIGALIVINLFATFIFPENKRLSEREISFFLLFDLGQLALMLFLTGGLTNPFALLILAPVVISASALSFPTTLLIGAASISVVSFLWHIYIPLRFESGTTLNVAPIFIFGFWLAITVGVSFIGFYAHRIANEMRAMSEALFATQMALAREQKLTDLGGVVAAAAHELGTPLATIKLTSHEMMSELQNDKTLYDDAALIYTQADRCSAILREMGRAGKDDLHMRSTPLISLIKEAAEPHEGRGKELLFSVHDANDKIGQQPTVHRRPEVIHGLRNLIQNAVDFAKTSVWIDAEWSEAEITIRITDDGEGYAPHIIGRLGDPFMGAKRPAYEGMGLGLFIAKTLLERSGAELIFANASEPLKSRASQNERSGAIVQVVWPKAALLSPDSALLGVHNPMAHDNREYT